jgi:hypothetical protein
MKYKVRFLQDKTVPYHNYKSGDVALITDWDYRNTEVCRKDWHGDSLVVECYGHGCFSGPLYWGVDIELIEE